MPVSMRPSAAVDDLFDIPLERVVARFKDTERRRTTKTEPDEQAEVHRLLRYAPIELISSLGVIASHLSISRAVLTKCMSHQVISWYENTLSLSKLTQEYNAIYAKIKLKGFRTLRIQAEHPAKFSFVQPTERVSTSVTTIRWVLSRLAEVSEVVGVGVTDLLLVGFCWSLTTLENQEWDSACIDQVFCKEADNISLLLRDRLIDVGALHAKYVIRVGCDDVIT